MRIRPYGSAALLAEPADSRLVLALAAALDADPAVLEVVPAARTVLVRAQRGALAGLAERLLGLEPGLRSVDVGQGLPVVLDVRYDGADLASTAAELALDPEQLVAAHTAGRYVVAFCGFVPGFAYLTGLDPALHVPRLAEPRTSVPAGSVAIAGEFTGVYPRASPGGWRLLGRTSAPLWDLERDPPTLLTPGTPVRFRAVATGR
ncbi:allophanate hydrolase subunit 1 [uncultured Jatrophihabitans sp.]|uniref:5-oxoprolinase subunit B family protein n=1 Tax=uncultured Jatrophihabitans sp. TaxID=1610747 RepID=UPI0035CB360C